MMHKKNGGGKMRGGHRRFQHRDRDRGGNRGQNDHQNVARQKHHATQMREKYSNHAKDAQMNGDVVEMEYYLQHVDHYVRVLSDIAAIENERFQQREQHHAQSDAEDVQEGDGARSQPQDAASAEAPRSVASDASAQESRPRRQYRPVRVIAPVETNENSGEIPLPASVIPAIHT